MLHFLGEDRIKRVLRCIFLAAQLGMLNLCIVKFIHVTLCQSTTHEHALSNMEYLLRFDLIAAMNNSATIKFKRMKLT